MIVRRMKIRDSNGLGPRVPKTLKEAIGRQGKPISIDKAFVGANPYFSPDYAAYSENCQRCVVAYELRRRGYDVTALPTYVGDNLPTIAYTKGRIYEGRWKGAFRNAKTLDVGANRATKVSANITAKMKEFGNGSRAVVQVFWHSGGGHVFSVENRNGRMVYMDPQTGRIRNINDTLSRAFTMDVNLVRTDNLRLSERAKNFVTRK